MRGHLFLHSCFGRQTMFGFKCMSEYGWVGLDEGLIAQIEDGENVRTYREQLINDLNPIMYSWVSQLPSEPCLFGKKMSKNRRRLKYRNINKFHAIAIFGCLFFCLFFFNMPTRPIKNATYYALRYSVYVPTKSDIFWLSWECSFPSRVI